MKKIITVAFIFWSVIMFAQPKGYFGKTTYLSVGMNFPLIGIEINKSASALRQFDFSVNKVLSKKIQILCSGLYSWNDRVEDAENNYKESSNLTSIEIGLRKYKNKKYKSIAPIGRFYEFDLAYLMINNTHTNYSENVVFSKIKSSMTMLQPGLKLGRQAIFFNRIICSAGCKICSPPIPLTSFNNHNSDITIYYFVRNLIGAFYSVGILF